MAIYAVGLTTHIYNNHLKSALLLAGFPVLLALMIGGFFGGLHLAKAYPPLHNSIEAYNILSYAAVDIDRPYTAKSASMLDWRGALESAKYGMLRYGHWAFLAASIWFVIAYFFHGAMMRAASGSMPVTREQMPKIYNMLENLCISRGITMPQFEVIDSPALNAFATGINDKTYKIVLTRGIIDRLKDDELEGVIAHELTHIINRDVRLLIIAVIFSGMISFFAEMAFRSIIHGRRPNYYLRGRDRKGGSILPVMIIAFAILAIGYILALAIRFAISRKREYLADAGAVELTKNPDAMMRALQRISGNDTVQSMPDEVQQMCIENSHNFMGVFATHPPIEDRIRTLSQITGTPIPDLQVSILRGPRKPWDNGTPPLTF